ncbi:hypothetical protein PV783_24595 [Chitinophaga sp. CC14]|uniref:hypothetical protein n=1 Tax=Chitinophaga sp. CC14 TaxID=3029199 RepID=UPI003B7FC308
MMTTNEKIQMFDALLSTTEWEGNVKLPATANRKIVLLFALVVEKELKEGSDLFTLFPKGLSEQLAAFIKECLEKAGLQVFYEKLKALK